MAKVRKGATIVLRLDELNLWIRRENRENQHGKEHGKLDDNQQSSRRALSRFKIVNRPLDFNKLPPCRAKIVYMGIPKLSRFRGPHLNACTHTRP